MRAFERGVLHDCERRPPQCLLATGPVPLGRATLDEVRRRAGRAADGRVRVTRRPGDDEVSWHQGAWPLTVADVCAGGVEEYGDRVMGWARCVRETLDAGQGAASR